MKQIYEVHPRIERGSELAAARSKMKRSNDC